MTALHWTALNGDVDTLQVLLYAGANLQPTTRVGGYTPLHLASREGKGVTVAALLAGGSDAMRYTDTGVTALHLAAQAGQPEAVIALLEHGADVNVRDGGAERTPLMFATVANRLAVMRTLIDAGAEISLETRLLDYVARSREDTAEQRARARVADAAKPPQPRAAPGVITARRVSAAVGGTPPAGGNAPPPDPDDPPVRGAQGAAQAPPDPDDPPVRGAQGAAQAPPDPDDPPVRGAQGAAQAPPDPDDPPARGARGAGQTLPDPDDPPARTGSGSARTRSSAKRCSSVSTSATHSTRRSEPHS